MFAQVFASAVVNARRAVLELSGSNKERQLLQPALEQGGPGTLQRLSRDECLRLLAARQVGRFAHVENAHALDVVPVNYACMPDGSLLFRTGPGPKLSAAERHDVVALEVDDIDEAGRTGWSVLVIGRAKRLTTAEARSLPDLPAPWASGPRRQVVRIVPTRIEGRRLA